MFFVGNSGAEVYITCTAIRLAFIRAKGQVDMIRNEKPPSVNYSLCCLRYAETSVPLSEDIETASLMIEEGPSPIRAIASSTLSGTVEEPLYVCRINKQYYEDSATDSSRVRRVRRFRGIRCVITWVHTTQPYSGNTGTNEVGAAST